MCAVAPPSTTTSAPVTNLAPSPLRNSTGATKSSGTASRPLGIDSIVALTLSRSESTGAVNALAVGPGETTLTRTPAGAHATASERARERAAPLAAQ